MSLVIFIAVGLAGHFWGPALGAYLAQLGLEPWAAGLVARGIKAIAPNLLNRAADLVTRGPLTEDERQTQRANVERQRQEAFGPL